MTHKQRGEAYLRALCDLVIVNVAYILALFSRYIWEVAFTAHSATAGAFLLRTVSIYAWTALPLSLIAVITFSLNGFYTRGRSYQSRFKALIVFQAVSLAYLIFAALVYFTPIKEGFPRAVLISGWAITLVAVELSRLWSTLWRKFGTTPAPSKREVDEKLILVIGGAGYIGSALLPKLLKEGYTVRLLDLFVYGKDAVKPYLDHPRVEVFEADFRQVDRVVKAVQGVSKVVHLGAIVGDPACALDEELTIEVNLIATKMIAEVCKGHGVERFVFASTCSVYGANDEVLDERSKLNPVSLYARSKIACERVLMDMADDSFSPVILRFSTIYGLSGRTRFDLVVNLLTAKAKFDRKITLYGGDQWRPFLHVDDAALSVHKVLFAPLNQVNKQVFNVGSNAENYTLADVANLIHELEPDSEIVDYGLDGDRRNYRVDFTKINRELGYRNAWTLKQGIQQVIDAINQGKVESYDHIAFDNARFLKSKGDGFVESRHMVSVLEMI